MIRLVRRKSAIQVPTGVSSCRDAWPPSAVRSPAPWLSPMLLSPAQSWSAEMPPTGSVSSHERLSHWRPAALQAYTVYTPACAVPAPASAQSTPVSAAIPPLVRPIPHEIYPRAIRSCGPLDACSGARAARAAGEAPGALDRGGEHLAPQPRLEREPVGEREAGALQQRPPVGQHRVLGEGGEALGDLERPRHVAAGRHDLGDEADRERL